MISEAAYKVDVYLINSSGNYLLYFLINILDLGIIT